mmetsp:Transcript_78457/g.233727  ORF Transcript_78457/g.233727 Transcript_78457/m.233727 type:complete len:223 (+) Transcript_78457:1597-2265(+)
MEVQPVSLMYFMSGLAADPTLPVISSRHSEKLEPTLHDFGTEHVLGTLQVLATLQLFATLLTEHLILPMYRARRRFPRRRRRASHILVTDSPHRDALVMVFQPHRAPLVTVSLPHLAALVMLSVPHSTAEVTRHEQNLQPPVVCERLLRSALTPSSACGSAQSTTSSPSSTSWTSASSATVWATRVCMRLVASRLVPRTDAPSAEHSALSGSQRPCSAAARG